MLKVPAETLTPPVKVFAVAKVSNAVPVLEIVVAPMMLPVPESTYETVFASKTSASALKFPSKLTVPLRTGFVELVVFLKMSEK